MKETRELWVHWKNSVQWDSKTLKQKLLCVWFSMSMIAVGVCSGTTLPLLLSLANLAVAAYYCVKNVPLNEEDE